MGSLFSSACSKIWLPVVVGVGSERCRGAIEKAFNVKENRLHLKHEWVMMDASEKNTTGCFTVPTEKYIELYISFCRLVGFSFRLSDFACCARQISLNQTEPDRQTDILWLICKRVGNARLFIEFPIATLHQINSSQ